MRKLSILFFFIVSGSAVGQNTTCKWIVSSVQSVPLDTLIIEPASVRVFPDVPFEYNKATQSIRILGQVDSVRVCYRFMWPDVFAPMFIRDITQYEASPVPKDYTSAAPPYTGVSFGSDVQKSGFISRGVTFGNRQNLFVNSMLNLQMQGKLSDNLYIDAVITDQNIPYQPEGNTQQIRDFDNVYIKLYNDSFDLTVGDIVLTNPYQEGYFLKYYKNVQGLQLNYRTKAGRWNSQSHIAASAAKGKFASTIVKAIEGSQGPYTLRGPNGERFIVVLANSERVYVDGKLLQRGFENDYVIDYNLGQVTFSTNVLITQFSVIRVDFEYAEQYYARTSVSAAQRLSDDKWDIRVNYYSEKDNQTGTLGFIPGADDLETLRSIGDNLALAQINGVDSIGFNPNQILYKRLDTLDLDGNVQSIFKYSTNSDSAFFVVGFNEVGFGNGDYVLLRSTANGRVFQWVSTQGGVSQGNYQPTRQVPLPIAKQMMTMAVDYNFNKYEKLSQELAVSRLDKNLYSNLDDADNQGLAWMGHIRSAGRSAINDYKLTAEVRWEVDQATFNPIDRYRPILFDRDWDYTPDGQQANDYMIWITAGIRKNEHEDVSYQLMRRERTNTFEGWQHTAKVNQRVGNFYYKSDHFLLVKLRDTLRSEWVRTLNDVSYRRGFVVPGYIFSMDRNTLAAGDSIVSTQMYFVANELYLTGADSSRTKFRISYQQRKDELPQQGSMETYTLSDNYTAALSRDFGKHQVGLTGTYRKINDQLNSLTDEWLNARTDWTGRFAKEHITHRLTYQIGNVRELRRDFIFVEVGGNQGTHAWRDENNDGIKDLNEFYEAVNPDERQYAKFFTPTDDFIQAFETRYQHVIDGRFPSVWYDRGGLPAFLSKWSAQASLQAHFKTTSPQAADRLNPFDIDEEGVHVIFASNRWRYAVYYNRTRPGLGWEGSYSLSERKQLLTNGFELGTMDDWFSAVSWRFNQTYTVRFKNQWGAQQNVSDFLLNRNLNIVRFGLGPELIWQPLNALRIIGEYNFRSKRNRQPDAPAETSDVSEWHGNLTWTQGAKGSLNVDIRFLKISYSGAPNTYAAYQMLEALQPGQNTTWRLGWQQIFGKGVQMTLQYNGRTSERQAPIHTGTVVMTAYF